MFINVTDFEPRCSYKIFPTKNKYFKKTNKPVDNIDNRTKTRASFVKLRTSPVCEFSSCNLRELFVTQKSLLGSLH